MYDGRRGGPENPVEAEGGDVEGRVDEPAADTVRMTRNENRRENAGEREGEGRR